jgi:hypothetical protein
MKKIIASICTLIISLSVLLVGGACSNGGTGGNTCTCSSSPQTPAMVEGLLLETDYVYTWEYEDEKTITVTLRFYEDSTFTKTRKDNATQEVQEFRGWFFVGTEEEFEDWDEEKRVVIYKKGYSIYTAIPERQRWGEESVSIDYTYYASIDNGKKLIANYGKHNNSTYNAVS